MYFLSPHIPAHSSFTSTFTYTRLVKVILLTVVHQSNYNSISSDSLHPGRLHIDIKPRLSILTTVFLLDHILPLVARCVGVSKAPTVP